MEHMGLLTCCQLLNSGLCLWEGQAHTLPPSDCAAGFSLQSSGKTIVHTARW